jgi:1-pyrroline-5-carboxylate dehydrogenase
MDGPMRLTYTSGEPDGEAGARFERSLDALRAAEPPTLRHWMAGRWVAAGAPFERLDPSRAGAVVARAHAAGEREVADAVGAAREARSAWSRTSYDERCTRLRALARAIEARHAELAAVVSLETGKVRSESLAEVQEAVDLIETYTAQLEAAHGFAAELASLSPGERNRDTLKPYGTFAVIVPFNFPVALAVNMLSAALLAGNTVVVKPSEKTPLTGALLAELVAQANLPAGVFNLVQGGPQTGEALTQAQIDGVAFTGSAQVGRAIAARLAQGPYPRPVLAELGGKNPAIVTANADLDKAAEGVARAAFGLSGQKCSSCSRAIVLDPVYERFLERLLAEVSEWRPCDPRDVSARLGPVIDEQAVERFRASVRAAEHDGRVLAGGRALEGGLFVEPTVVDRLPPGHDLTRRELFLPFLAVVRAADLDGAIAEANAVDYGLTAGIFSEDPQEVERFAEDVQAGVLFANRRAGATTGAWPGMQSFCGWKSSGLTGKGGLGPYYVQQFAREQSLTIVE